MRTVRITGIPLDLGQERRGVDMGPSAVRGAGLKFTLESLGLGFDALTWKPLFAPRPKVEMMIVPLEALKEALSAERPTEL